MTSLSDEPGLPASPFRLNKRLFTASTWPAKAYLDAWDAVVERITALDLMVVERWPNDTLKSVLTTQIELSRQLSLASTSLFRSLIP
jgi:hypothetical protein